MAEALAGLRVLEAGAGAAVAYAGKLFADFGADVLKLDGPDGLARAWPSVDGRSATQGWLNANKRLVRGEVAALAPGCHVLLDARPEAPEAMPPHLVHTRVSWFGESGPYRNFAATDVTCRALAGVFACTGPVEEPPAMLGGIAGEVLGGIAAFTAAAAAVWGGGGRRLECSVHEANIAIAEYQAAQAVTNPEVERRLGINRFAPTCPLGVYRCREGWLGVTVVTPAQWRAFCGMIGLEDLAHDPSLVVGLERLEHADRLDALIADRLRVRTAPDWFAEALERRLPFAVVPGMAALLATPTHRARNAFQRVAMGSVRFEGPTLPQRLTRTPPRAHGTVRLAADTTPVLPALPGTAARAPLPLEGLRVLDLCMGWAGPLCTRTLGDLGAEVIKVEAIQYPDWWRGVDPRPAFFSERRYEKDVRFAFQNRSKRGLTLDLARPAGAALLHRLVAVSDAVAENYARDVLPKLGLDYPALRRSRPDLVMLSMPAFGADGPWRDARAYGSTLEHASGPPHRVWRVRAEGRLHVGLGGDQHHVAEPEFLSGHRLPAGGLRAALPRLPRASGVRRDSGAGRGPRRGRRAGAHPARAWAPSVTAAARTSPWNG